MFPLRHCTCLIIQLSRFCQPLLLVGLSACSISRKQSGTRRAAEGSSLVDNNKWNSSAQIIRSLSPVPKVKEAWLPPPTNQIPAFIIIVIVVNHVLGLGCDAPHDHRRTRILYAGRIYPWHACVDGGSHAAKMQTRRLLYGTILLMIGRVISDNSSKSG